MHLRILLSWVILAQAAGQQLALTASTQFRMILSPTSLELKSAALKVLKEAAVDHVFKYSLSQAGTNNATEITTVKLASIEIVFRNEEFLSDARATKVSFFALATYRASEPDEMVTRAERQAMLNSLLKQAFSTTDQFALFLQRIRELVSDEDSETYREASPEQLQILEGLMTVSVLPSIAVPSSIKSDSRANFLSTLDIILLVVCAIILVGMLWILWENCKNLGYNGNRRWQVHTSREPNLFAIPRAYFEEGFSVRDEESEFDNEYLSASVDRSRFSAYDCSPILELHEMIIEPSLSTPSTIASSMIMYSEEESSPQLSESDWTGAVIGKCPPRTTREPCNLLPLYQSDEDKEVVSDFANNWFRQDASSFLPRRAAPRVDLSQDGKHEESAKEDDNSSSDDDVFFVARMPSHHSSSRWSLEYSISEWMSTIQVTPPASSAAASVFSVGSGSMSQENETTADGSARSYSVASLLELSSLEPNSTAPLSSNSNESISTNDEKKTGHR